MTEATEDPDIVELAARRRRARGLRVAARRALGLARRYRTEEGPRGVRETACVRQALAWRASARELRNGRADRPGVARASAPPPSSSEKAQSG
ncbi:MAG: hypothetical protein U0270_29340 [Labilithrix sp.]